MSNAALIAERIRDHIYEGGVIASRIQREAPRLIRSLLKGKPALSLRSLSEAVCLSPTYLSHVKNGKVLCSFGAFLALEEFASGNRL